MQWSWDLVSCGDVCFMWCYFDGDFDGISFRGRDPALQISCGTPDYQAGVGRASHTLVVWCLKMSNFVLVGCLFDTLCLAGTICLLVAGASLLPPGVFFSGCPAQSVLLASSHPPTD